MKLRSCNARSNGSRNGCKSIVRWALWRRRSGRSEWVWCRCWRSAKRTRCPLGARYRDRSRRSSSRRIHCRNTCRRCGVKGLRATSSITGKFAATTKAELVVRLIVFVAFCTGNHGCLPFVPTPKCLHEAARDPQTRSRHGPALARHEFGSKSRFCCQCQRA